MKDRIKEFITIMQKYKEKKNLTTIDCIINLILLTIIASGICISFYMLFVARTLWIDEAMFAISMSKRSLINLTFGVFEANQIGPIIYIYLVKLIITIMGNSEVTLRLLSVIAYILTLFMSYKIAKNVFKFRYSLLPVAYIAVIPYILRYSNEFKVYMFDCFICLLVIYMYYLYNEKKLNLKMLTLVFAIIVWASNPACFLIGGILACEFLLSLQNKDYKHTINIVVSGICVIVSFVVYYLYWLNGVATSSGMQGFWYDFRLPLIPTNLDELGKLSELTFNIINILGNFGVLLFILALISIVLGFKNENKYKISIAFGMLITLFASYAYMFPVSPRMWLFIYPITALLAFDTINKILPKERIKLIIVLSICLVIILQNNGVVLYSNKENIYTASSGINFLTDYVQENIKEDEKLYVYYYASYAVKYKLGYDTKTIGKYDSEIIYGDEEFLRERDELKKLGQELTGIQLDKIINEEKVYILISMYMPSSDIDMRALKKAGYLETISDSYGDKLYYYTKDIKNLKSKVRYKVLNTKIENGRYILDLAVNNSGKTIIDSEFDEFYIGSRQDKGAKVKVKETIKPQETICVKVEVYFDENEEIELQLYNQDEYWFDELGVEPVRITKDMFVSE